MATYFEHQRTTDDAAAIDPARSTKNEEDGREPNEPMDETQLKAVLQNEIYQALGTDGGKLSFDRRRALEYYEGLPRGDEIDGRSQVTSRNVLEVIEWSLPAILRIFLSSERVFEFEPTRPGEEAMAEAASMYCNHILLRDNPGFMVLYEWIKTSLLQKMGYIKVYWQDERTFTTNTFTGLTEAEYHAVTDGDDVEVMNVNKYPNPDPQMNWYNLDDPNPGQPTLYDCTLRVWTTEGKVKIEHCVPEEILVSRRAPSSVLDGNHYVAHRTIKRVTDLRELGYDEDLIEQAVGFNIQELNSERISRFAQEEDWPFIGGDRFDPAMRLCYLEENYLRIDYDGDGIAELRRVVTAGNGQVVFSNEPWDEVPIVSLCPLPFPGKHVGMSVADLVIDLQDISTTLLRQILDNLYLVNAPRIAISETAIGDDTIEDLLNVRPGGIIRVNDVQGLQPIETPFVAQASMPFMEFLNNIQEVRTGISRQNQTISVDDLNKHASGTAIQTAQNAANQRIELIARTFAETGMKQLAKKILGLVIRHQQQGRVIRLSGQWLTFDPRTWRESMDVTIDVGLGTGNRDQVLAHLMSILQVQAQIVTQQKGIQGPLVTAQNVYDVVSKVCHNAGFKETFFTDPRTVDPRAMQQQQQQDPETMKAQAQAQAAQAQAQAQMQIQKAKADQEMQIEQMRAQHEGQLAEQRASHEMNLERMREESRQNIEMMKVQAANQRADAQAAHEMSQPRPVSSSS